MLAAFVSTPAPKDPLSVLEVGDRPEPEVPDGWTTVQVKAVSLNHHDLFSLRGIGLPAERMPMILGTDAAGIDADGNEVVVHGVIATPGWTGDETLDPKRSLLSEVHQGTMAERVAVPTRNLVPKPADLSFAEAACLPTAWLTAYRMLFENWTADDAIHEMFDFRFNTIWFRNPGFLKRLDIERVRKRMQRAP